MHINATHREDIDVVSYHCNNKLEHIKTCLQCYLWFVL